MGFLPGLYVANHCLGHSLSHCRLINILALVSPKLDIERFARINMADESGFDGLEPLALVLQNLLHEDSGNRPISCQS